MTEQEKKTKYVKPEILDLGRVAPIHGGFCPSGSLNTLGDCAPTGGIASGGTCLPAGHSAATP
jgi:hypothetical protein